MPQVRWKENQLDTYTKYISPLHMGSSRMIERGGGGSSEDEGGALCYSLGVEEIGGCDDVLEK